MSPRGKRDADTPFLSQTEISAERTAAEIQEILGRRAKRVMTEYDAGEVVAISFSLIIQDKEVFFRLPVRWRNYFKVLQEAAKKKRGNSLVEPEQARRTAWRVAKAGLEAQLAWVDSGMVEIQEVFLPYVVQGKDQETLYERLAKSDFLLEHK
jgi:hypothetical protein